MSSKLLSAEQMQLWDALSSTQFMVAAAIGQGKSDEGISGELNVKDVKEVAGDVAKSLSISTGTYGGDRQSIVEQYRSYTETKRGGASVTNKTPALKHRTSEETGTVADAKEASSATSADPTNERAARAASTQGAVMTAKHIQSAASKLAALSVGNRKFAKFVAVGLTNERICATTGLEKGSVATGISSLYKKVGLNALPKSERRAALGEAFKAMPKKAQEIDSSPSATSSGRRSRKARKKSPTAKNKVVRQAAPRATRVSTTSANEGVVAQIAALGEDARALSAAASQLAKLVTPELLRELARAQKVLKAAQE